MNASIKPGAIHGLFEYPTNMRFVGFENRLGHDLECYSPVTCRRDGESLRHGS
jgi:hypothetical protein